ncbi:hypothetical protein [Nocardia gipuzkoensis]|uniref:hypothetical protein n=1 Tax=Nocardia gipuzkoensis TaxID=2749991 RepID=UPI00237DD473|nr:hypothetical protein [Nocardia gipuzkoensis]MDE1671499.1 hypothetical protein [Nocardia gipuzkoensis]
MGTSEQDTGTSAVPLLESVIDCVGAIAMLGGLDAEFVYRDQVALDGLHGRFESLTLDDPSVRVFTTFLAHNALPAEPTRITVRRFRRGDCMLPQHVSGVFDPVADDVDWVSVCTLADSAVDGITFAYGDRFHRVLDVAGRILTIDPDTWWWSSPTGEEIRYVVTVGGGNA